MTNINIPTDKYIRPNITYTDTLSKNEIMEFLQDFEQVDDIDKIKIGSYISYIDLDKNNSFRLGGMVIQAKDDYFILASGRITFSVQKSNKIFFKRLNYTELKKEIEQDIKFYKNIINEKDKQIKNLVEYINFLKNNNNNDKIDNKKN